MIVTILLKSDRLLVYICYEFLGLDLDFTLDELPFDRWLDLECLVL